MLPGGTVIIVMRDSFSVSIGIGIFDPALKTSISIWQMVISTVCFGGRNILPSADSQRARTDVNHLGQGSMDEMYPVGIAVSDVLSHALAGYRQLGRALSRDMGHAFSRI